MKAARTRLGDKKFDEKDLQCQARKTLEASEAAETKDNGQVF